MSFICKKYNDQDKSVNQRIKLRTVWLVIVICIVDPVCAIGDCVEITKTQQFFLK